MYKSQSRHPAIQSRQKRRQNHRSSPPPCRAPSGQSPAFLRWATHDRARVAAACCLTVLASTAPMPAAPRSRNAISLEQGHTAETPHLSGASARTFSAHPTDLLDRLILPIANHRRSMRQTTCTSAASSAAPRQRRLEHPAATRPNPNALKRRAENGIRSPTPRRKHPGNHRSEPQWSGSRSIVTKPRASFRQAEKHRQEVLRRVSIRAPSPNGAGAPECNHATSVRC